MSDRCCTTDSELSIDPCENTNDMYVKPAISLSRLIEQRFLSFVNRSLIYQSLSIGSVSLQE